MTYARDVRKTQGHEHTLRPDDPQALLDGETIDRCFECNAWLCPDCSLDFEPPTYSGNAPRGWRVHRLRCAAKHGKTYRAYGFGSAK